MILRFLPRWPTVALTVRHQPGRTHPSFLGEGFQILCRKKGMSKSRAAAIANTPDASEKGGKKSGSGGNRAQKQAAGRKGGKASS